MTHPTPAAQLTLAAANGERATGRQAWSLLWGSTRRLAVAVAVWAAAQTIAPVLVVLALGSVVARVPGAVAHGLASSDGDRLAESLVMAALAYGSSLVLDPVGNALGMAAKARLTNDLQQRLLAAVSAPVGVAHLEDPGVLDRLARAEGSLTGYFPGDAPVTWVGGLASRLSGVIACIVIAWFAWWLGLLLLAVWLSVRKLMLAAVVRHAMEQRVQTTAMRRSWYLAAVGTKARDAKEVRVFGLTHFLSGRFAQVYAEAVRAGESGLRTVHQRALVCWALVFGGFGLALALIVRAARDGTIDLHALAVLVPMLAVTMSAGSVGSADLGLVWTLAGLPDVERLERELGASRTELPGARPVDGLPREAVRFSGVRFRYPSTHRDVLDGLDLDIVAGQATAIVGVNGAGKSTLVSLLSRLRDPTSGAITVDGIDVRELVPAQWQRLVALMPQQPVRYPTTAYDNIAFGAIEHRDDAEGVADVARLAGVADVVEALPDGWQTVLSRELPRGVDLSGGQWQRLALARALFATRHGARILVLDEPTAALDVRSEARFYEQFLRITAGLTTVLISHRFATVRRADVICVLDGGRITERGSHDELLARGGTYANAYRLQARRFSAAQS
jgi:ATP-binding cassette subfamily B protein